MKTNNTCALIFVLFVSICWAQFNNSYLITKYNEFKTEEREVPDQYIGSYKNDHYLIYSKGKYGYGTSELKKFNTDFQPTGQNIVLTRNNNDQKTKEYSLGVIEVDNKLLCITVKNSKGFKKYYSKTISLDKFKITSEKEILNLSIDDTNMKWLYSSFIYSKDKKTFGLFYEVPSKENNKYTLILFDDNFNEINKHHYEFKAEGKFFNVKNGTLLNNQEMIILTEDLNNVAKKEISKKIPNYNYNLFSIKEGSINSIGPVPTYGKWVNFFEFNADDDSIKLMGLYGESGKFTSNGTFFHKVSRIEPKDDINKITPFQKSLLNQHIEISNFKSGLKKRIKKHNELPYYIVTSKHRYSDDAFLVIAEQTHTFSSNFITTYHYENLLLIMFNKNGDIRFTKMIKKDNSNVNTRIYSSYLVTENNDDYVIMYNGSRKNLLPNNPRRHNAFKGFDDDESFILTFLDNNGNTKSHAITSKSKLEDYRIRPMLSSKLEDGRILLFAQKPSNVKHQRFITLELKNKNPEK